MPSDVTSLVVGSVTWFGLPGELDAIDAVTTSHTSDLSPRRNMSSSEFLSSTDSEISDGDSSLEHVRVYFCFVVGGSNLYL